MDITDQILGLGFYAFITYGYWIVFLITIIENLPVVGFFMPGTILLILAGFLTPMLGLDIITLLVVAIIGVILGDGFGYMIGRHYGRSVLRAHGWRLGFHRKHQKTVEEFFQKWGAWSIIIARFTSFMRPIAPAFAGCIHMPARRFWLANVVGGTLWSITFGLLGFYFGSSFPSIQDFILNIL